MSITGIKWAGPRAWLVELTDLASVLALHQRLAAEPFPGQLDTVAAAATLLVKFSSQRQAVLAHAAVGQLDLGRRERATGNEVTIEVVYDGEDLAEVGRLTGLGADGVVAAHTGQVWTAAFGGFAPGFTYLVGQDNRLEVPRRRSPRTAVPAGAVALGGAFSAVYPRQSPGGWQLIGRTAAVMWDLGRESPALVRPGDHVRYQAVREFIEVAGSAVSAAPESSLSTASALVVTAPGLQALVQDLGRPGFGDLGVSAAGAADQQSARQANRLVGNEPAAAVVENLLGGLTVLARGDQVVSVAGATVPLEIHDVSGTVRHRPAMCSPFALLDGESLALGAPSSGLRSYLGIRGGFDVAPVLGSRSSDSMSGIGPAPLAAGRILPVAAVAAPHPVGSPEPSTLRLDSAPAALRVTLGPRDDWFSAEALRSLSCREWLVTAQSNRIGVRLTPTGTDTVPESAAVLERSRTGELPSEGAVAGSLQVPPSGHPVLFLADHPVTGGYPVIAVLVPEDLPLAAQLPPGHRVRFHIVDHATLKPAETTSRQSPARLEPAVSGPAPEGSQP